MVPRLIRLTTWANQWSQSSFAQCTRSTCPSIQGFSNWSRSAALLITFSSGLPTAYPSAIVMKVSPRVKLQALEFQQPRLETAILSTEATHLKSLMTLSEHVSLQCDQPPPKEKRKLGSQGSQMTGLQQSQFRRVTDASSSPRPQ